MFSNLDYISLILKTLRKRKLYAFIGLVYFLVFYKSIKNAENNTKQKNSIFRYIMD